MYSRKEIYVKAVVILAIILFISLILLGLYYLLAKLKTENNNNAKTTTASSSFFDIPADGIAIEDYSKDKALRITGKADKNYYIKDNYIYLDLIADENGRIIVPIILGKEQFKIAFRYTTSSGDGQISGLKRLEYILPKIAEAVKMHKKLSIWVYLYSSDNELKARLAKPDCDLSCKDQLNLMIVMRALNVNIAENYKKGWEKGYTVGPLGQIQIYE